MKPKLLLAITKSNWGGAQKYIFDIATNLEIRSRFEVMVLTGSEGELVSKLKEEGIKVYLENKIKRDVNILSDFFSIIYLYRVIKEINPDIIHLNSSKMGFTGAIASRIVGVNNIVFTAHGWPFNENRHIVSRTIFKIICAGIIVLAHKTIAVSKNVRDSFRFSKYLVNKMQVIYNGIEKFDYKSLPKLSEGSSSTHVVSIGELHPSKNHISVIRMLKFMKNIHYHIIGSGELRGELEQEIIKHEASRKVTLHGHIKSAHEILPQFDIFLLPSRTDALPYVINEALRAGLPVVARSVGGVPELLDGVKTGKLYTHDSELINILNTHDKKGEKIINEKFTLENMIAETKNLYLTLLSR